MEVIFLLKLGLLPIIYSGFVLMNRSYLLDILIFPYNWFKEVFGFKK